MMVIYVLYSEKLGEWEGVFTEHGKLLGYWHCNDASWRNEYFSGFLAQLGVIVKDTLPPALRKKCEQALRLAISKPQP